MCRYIIVIIGLECGIFQLECDMQISLHDISLHDNDISMYSFFLVSVFLYSVLCMHTSVYACGLLMYR